MSSIKGTCTSSTPPHLHCGVLILKNSSMSTHHIVLILTKFSTSPLWRVVPQVYPTSAHHVAFNLKKFSTSPLWRLVYQVYSTSAYNCFISQIMLSLTSKNFKKKIRNLMDFFYGLVQMDLSLFLLGFYS